MDSPCYADVLAAAHDYARRGWRVVPLHYITDGGACSCTWRAKCGTPGKHPVDTNWPDLASCSGADVQAWWDEDPRRNVGIATGAATGLFAVDIDPENGGLAGLQSLLEDNGPMPTTRMHQTGSGGLHYLFCWPDFDVRNSSKYLAPGIDIRGTGGQVVAPPSVSGKGPYAVLADTDPAPAPEWLLERLREHSRRAQRGLRVEVENPEPVDVERIPPEVRQLATTRVAKDAGRFRHFYSLIAACRRAGYSKGQTVTIVTPWCQDVDKFVGRIANEVARAWGKLEEEERREEQWLPGLHRPIAGSSALVPLSSAPAIHPDAAQAPAAAAAPAEPTGDVAAPERTTWWPRSLEPVLAGREDEPAPAFLARADGQRLFYAGKVNGLLGESESGKTWVALLAVAQALTEGVPVLYLDFEDTAPGIVGRLRALGVTDEQFGWLHYVGPEETLHLTASEDLKETLALVAPRLVVLDGFNAAMTLLGLDLDNNRDATQFSQVLLRPLAATGACVVYVDHVPKNKDNRGKGGIGAQAKRAMTTGCALAVDVLAPFGRGMTGRLKLTVDKDRPGHVRAVSGQAKHVGVATLDSDPDTLAVTVRIQSGDAEEQQRAVDAEQMMLMERLSEWLFEAPERSSQAAAERAMGGRAEAVRAALKRLVEGGFVRRESGHRHVLERPFSVADALCTAHLVHSSRPRPDLVPDEGARLLVNLVHSSHPLRGDEDEDEAAGVREADLKIDPRTGEILGWDEA